MIFFVCVTGSFTLKKNVYENIDHGVGQAMDRIRFWTN